jgi:hypothetical protein
VHFSRTGLEALEGLLPRLLGFEVYLEDLLFRSLVRDGGLTADEIHGEAFWVFDCEGEASTGGGIPFGDVGYYFGAG